MYRKLSRKSDENIGATDGTLGTFLNYGSIWGFEKDMHLDLFVAYLT